MTTSCRGWPAGCRSPASPDGPPTKTGLSLVDYSGGYVAAISLLAGLHAARRDGIGIDCDLSLYDTAVTLLTYPATWHLNGDWIPQRTRHSAHPSLVPFQNFEAADGWLVVGCAKEKFWQRLTKVIERPELAANPEFATFAQRREHADVLVPLLEEIFRTRTVAEWLGRLLRCGHPLRAGQRRCDGAGRRAYSRPRACRGDGASSLRYCPAAGLPSPGRVQPPQLPPGTRPRRGPRVHSP